MGDNYVTLGFVNSHLQIGKLLFPKSSQALFSPIYTNNLTLLFKSAIAVLLNII